MLTMQGWTFMVVDPNTDRERYEAQRGRETLAVWWDYGPDGDGWCMDWFPGDDTAPSRVALDANDPENVREALAEALVEAGWPPADDA